MLQLLLREAFRRRETWMWPRGSKWVSECVPGICILWDTHGCRGTRAENSGRFTAIMVFLFSRTATRISSVRTLSTFTPCVSRRVNCGASKPHRKIPFTLTCGTTTLSQPSLTKGPESLAALPRLPRDEGGPVFAEPWQAQAFALAVELSEHGHFTWKEWSTALADELKVAASRGEPDDGSHYYEHWLAALERLVVAKGLSDSGAMLARKEAWADAYRHTPHGKPVELASTREESPQNNESL